MSQKKQRPTSKQVADHAGVSQTTVSIVLNRRDDIQIPEATRARVLEAAEALGYVLPSSKKKATYIGVIVPTLANPFYPKLIGDIEEAAAAKGLHIVILNARRSQAEEMLCLDCLRKQKVEGLAFAYTPFSKENLMAFAKDIPVVLLGEEVEGLPLDTLSFSSVRAGEI
ncbi:MAG TPA: LacI family DNA-binding transcriptional regulator, partial [Clostridia bacterium]|nr:LacI family DNA-binding transcriptional regulator [Clostridia bacterium]